MKPRFQLRHAFVIFAIGACVLAILTRRSYQTTKIQIIENRLSQKSNGEISGHLIWCINDESEDALASPFVICRFQDYTSSNPEKLLALERGSEISVRWCDQQMFFSGEHPFDVFIVRQLNIKPNQVTGTRSGQLTEFLVSDQG